MKAWSHSSFQSALLAPFKLIKNGFSLYVKRDMNCLRVASLLVSCYTPFLEVGARESIIALSCTGLASIPL